MERLTTKKCGELLIKYNDGEYRSPCFGCESINKCNQEKVTCGFHKALEKLAEYEDLEKQGKLLILPCAVGGIGFMSLIQTKDCQTRKLRYTTLTILLQINRTLIFTDVSSTEKKLKLH